MPTLKYVLKAGKGSTAKIHLFYNYGANNRLRYSTGLQILNIKNWNEKPQRIKNVTEEVEKVNVNNKLDQIQAFINGLYSDLSTKENATVTNEILTNELNIFLNKKVKSEKEKERFLEFLPFYNWFIEHYKTNPLPTTKKPLGKGTAKTYNNAYTILNNFSTEKGLNLTYKKITLDFYDDFLNYLYSKNHSTNYIGTQIKILKTIMNASFEKDFHTNTDFKKRYFAKPTEEIANIYLNEEELQSIYNLDLTDFKPKLINKTFKLTRPMLENARDLFLIGANTGLRISDFNRLTVKNIITANNNQYINLITTKTNTLLTIPINTMVSNILAKRGGKPPKKMPEQHLNYAIKEIGKIAKIESKEVKTITKGGKLVILNIEKYNFISSHTARRSFCTNAYKSGMPTIDIMAISGHKTEKVFYNYIKVNDLERAEKIRKHSFFTNTNSNLKLA